jgi:predicted transcriptional regulator
MSRDLKTILERDSALEAFQRMTRDGYGQLIVTDDAGRMVGIVTEGDLMRAIRIRMAGAGAARSNGSDHDGGY